MSEDYLNYDPAQKRGDSLSETWRDPNKPKLKNIKDEDVAYELRELSKYTSLSPEVINIICHGYARICQLERERDEARREADELRKETWDHGGAFGAWERDRDA
jgi:hypothetical protein